MRTTAVWLALLVRGCCSRLMAAKSLLITAAARSRALGSRRVRRAARHGAARVHPRRPAPAPGRHRRRRRGARPPDRELRRSASARSFATSSPATSCTSRAASAARASATSSRCSGPATGKAVLLNAHYDSTPVGPGAADDGIGVATLLEVASILRNAPLKRPVILLFNEGEELGLIGARAFLARPAEPQRRQPDQPRGARRARARRRCSRPADPTAPRSRVFAARGDAARSPIRCRPTSTGCIPNYTDVNSFSERGWLTLNFALDRQRDPLSLARRRRRRARPASLAAHGRPSACARRRRLRTGSRKPAGGDRIFMDVAGRTLITLPLTRRGRPADRLAASASRGRAGHAASRPRSRASCSAALRRHRPRCRGSRSR